MNASPDDLPGALVVSLDFELHWGVRDHPAADGPYREHSSAPARPSSGRSTSSPPTTWRRHGRRSGSCSPARGTNWKRPARRCALPTRTPDSIPTRNPSGRRGERPAALRAVAGRANPADAAAGDRDAHVRALLLRGAGRDAGFVRGGPAGRAAARGPRRNTCAPSSSPATRAARPTWRYCRRCGHRRVPGESAGAVVAGGGGSEGGDPAACRAPARHVSAGDGDDTVGWETVPEPGGLANVRASRFLRPYNPRLAALEPLRLRRITRSLTRAARQGRIYHLWWHPHNFGTHLDANLGVLRRILDAFADLREREGMVSLSMDEVADRARAATG